MKHVSVLLEEAIESLAIKPEGTYVDLTLGRAGHSREILKRIPQGHLYCFDKDATALTESKPRLEEVGTNFTLIQSDFSHFKEELEARGVSKVDGILADLGVSSPQFDDPSRGFSYRYDARLDMRMDQSQRLDAYEVVNHYPFEKLLQVLRDYGEDPDAYRIAIEIDKRRSLAPIETTFQLVDIIKAAKPAKALAKKGHPAKQTFQALRIEVNGEEDALEALLQDGPDLLKEDGRLSIITFMSLDDRLVKRRFASLATVEGSRHGFLRPEEIEAPEFDLPSKKAILPSEEEMVENPRSISAKLRTLRKK